MRLIDILKENNAQISKLTKERKKIKYFLYRQGRTWLHSGADNAVERFQSIADPVYKRLYQNSKDLESIIGTMGVIEFDSFMQTLITCYGK